jgi:hypothetical protein
MYLEKYFFQKFLKTCVTFSGEKTQLFLGQFEQKTIKYFYISSPVAKTYQTKKTELSIMLES